MCDIYLLIHIHRNKHPQAKDAMRGRDHGMNLTDWKPPTDSVNLSYREWLELAKKHGKGDGEHWYFRVGDANNKVTMTNWCYNCLLHGEAVISTKG